MPIEEQVCILYAGVRGFLDKLQTSEISKFEELYLALIRSKHLHIFTAIRTEGLLNKKIDGELKALLEEFMPSSGLKMKA
jgi:F-type H+-transporting ATPase subunit alpha